jgi:N-acetylmuramoyl-L-alanine amidase
VNVTTDHWLEGVKRSLLPGGSAMRTRRFLVIHFTAGASAASSIEWWRKPAARGASAHIVIDRDGTLIQCRPFNLTCGHAGKSKWRDPKTGQLYTGLNACSIGVELANGGDSFPRKFSTLEPVKAAHKHGGPVAEWERYTSAQLAACEKVAQTLVKRYKLDDVIGHEDIARGRKVDPGPAFPMAALRAACGFTAAIPVL